MWALALIGIGCTESPAKPGAAAAGPSAIVLVVDGLRTDEFCGTTPSDLTGVPGDAMAPEVWSRVAPAARFSRDALNTGVTITAPAHAMFVTGRNEPYANFPIEPDLGPGLYRPLVPTIFEEARAALGVGEDDVRLIANTGLIEGVRVSAVPAGGASSGAAWTMVRAPDGTEGRQADDDGVFDELMRAIEADAPRLVVVNLHDVDRAGHYSDDPVYPMRITTVDSELAAFWDWVNAEHPDYAAELMLVITADHGRHRDDVADGWRSHGDACDGCREVPLFVLGPGVEPGEFAAAPLSVDLAPTLAAHLGFALPWAEGLPYEGFATDIGVRSGTFSVARSGDTTAAQVWRDDPGARSEVVIDGESVSTPGVLAAEAPVVFEASFGRFACWRELTEGGVDRPWVARCLADTGDGWAEMPFAVGRVSPFWAVSLAERDGELWASWAENVNAAVEHQEGAVGLAVARWTAEGGWSEPTLTDAWFPTDPALAVTPGGLAVAHGTNLDDPDGRYTRRARVTRFTLAADGAPTAAGFTDFARDDARVELPALAADGDALHLVMLVITDAGAHLETATSADGGVTWTEAAPLVGSEAVSTHLRPAWDGADVVWGATDAGAAVLCRAAPGDAEPACVDIGSPRLQSFSVAGGAGTVVRDAGEAAWESAPVEW